MLRSLDLLAIGDTTTDTFLQLPESRVRRTASARGPELCVPFGGKVPVESLTVVPGAGNAANCAVGAAALGLRVALASVVGSDERGRAALTSLAAANVDVREVVRDRAHETNASTIVSAFGDRTIFSYHAPHRYTTVSFPKAKFVYFSSISTDHSFVHERLLGYIEKTHARLIFSPGTGQLSLGRDTLAPILEKTEVLCLNKEEGEVLAGKRSSVRELLHALSQLGPQIVVLTDGHHGSYALEGNQAYACDIVDLPVVERTGAGDAYASAFVAARVHGLTVPEAMRWGTLQSAHVVGKVGSQAGLLTHKELLVASSTYAHVSPTELP